MRILWLSLVVASLARPALAQGVKFPLNGDNTKIEFVGSKPDGRTVHNGGFRTVTGTATAEKGLKIEIEIDMTSVYSDTPKLSEHLKSADFFAVRDNPTSRFVTTKIEKTADGGFNVTGELTLLGKAKAVTFPAKITLTEANITLNAEFRINRHEIGITYGKGQINDEVVLKLTVNAKK